MLPNSYTRLFMSLGGHAADYYVVVEGDSQGSGPVEKPANAHFVS